MTRTSAWDEVDAALFAVVRDTPATLTELIEVTGLPADVVKPLLHAYVKGGMVARSGLATIRYELTLLGQRRLRDLTPTQIAKAA